MKGKNSWKRVIAGMLAVLVMAATVPAGTDFGGYFGGTDIVASADTSEQSETIATNQREYTYTGTNVTITAQDRGGSYGMYLSSTYSATISVADGYKITKAEFTSGFSRNPISYFSSAAGKVTYSDTVATVSDVNAQSLTVNGTGGVYIKQVKVYYEVSAEKSTTIATNQSLTTYYGTNVTITAEDKGDPSGMLLGVDHATVSVSDGYIITKVEFTKGSGDINDLRSSAGNVTRSGDVATVSDVNAQSLVVSATPHDLNIKQVKVYYTEKTEWAVGDNINLDGKWFFVSDWDTIRARGKNSSAAVPTPIYDDEAIQWLFRDFISIDQVSEQGSGYMEAEGVTSLFISKPSDKSSAVKPIGIKIKSGSGTQADPYTFELVYPPKVDVTGVELDKTTATIPYGGTEPLTLTATIAPDGATDKTVTWSSSNTDVATVDANGKVTAVKAGTATITATATNGTADDTTDDKTATCTVTVSKIDPTVTTAPTAKENLKYNGNEQELITAGTSEDGTVQYAVVETDDDDYAIAMRDTDELLNLADVEVNTIYTPDLEGDNQGNEGVRFSSSTNFKIDDITYTGSIGLFYNPDDSKYYLDTDKGYLPLPEGCDGLLITEIDSDSGNVYAEIVNTANPAGDVQIDEEAWVESIPKETDAGEYNVYYRVKGDANHNNTKPVKIENVKIAKANASVVVPSAKTLTYNGKAQELVTAASSKDGQVQYAMSTDPNTEPESSKFSPDIPSETDAGKYYVWFRVMGDSNHKDTKTICIPVEIKKATVTVTANNLSKKCGAKDPELTYKATGFVGNDKLTGELTREEGENVGKYKITQGTLAASDNYTLSFTGADFTIENIYFKIIFANDDGTVLQNTEVCNGEMPEYTGETPTKPATDQYVYIFKGWDKTIAAVTGAATYTATYDSAKVKYTVTAEKCEGGKVSADKTNVAWGETVTVTPTANDGYVIKGVYLNGKQMAVNDKGKYQFEMPKNDVKVTAVFEKKQSSIVRVSGDTRFDTAAEISKASFTKADTVVLAYGLNYADALAGVTLANKLNAPILLTHTAKLPDETLAEIKRLGAKKVIILGGTGAISKNVEKTLKKNGLTTERYAGTTRFGTAAAIAEKLNDKPTDIYFVYAFNYADALSVSTVAALKNAPIIYLRTSGELDKDTADYLAKLKKAGSVKNAYVIGGEGVISKDMLNKAGKALGVTPTRVAGKNRYATCVEVNKNFADVLKGDKICVATGMNFPDALAGGVYAAKNKAPLFLINGNEKTPNLLAEQKSFLKAKNSHDIIIFGGTGAVSDSAVKAITDTITEKAKK